MGGRRADGMVLHRWVCAGLSRAGLMYSTGTYQQGAAASALALVGNTKGTCSM